jgi:hypothetical protein
MPSSPFATERGRCARRRRSAGGWRGGRAVGVPGLVSRRGPAPACRINLQSGLVEQSAGATITFPAHGSAAEEPVGGVTTGSDPKTNVPTTRFGPHALRDRNGYCRLFRRRFHTQPLDVARDPGDVR